MYYDWHRRHSEILYIPCSVRSSHTDDVANLLLGLGAAVVKAARKGMGGRSGFHWRRERRGDRRHQGQGRGELDQWLARRLFEDLRVPVAAKLSVLRQHEFGGMPAVLTIAPYFAHGHQK
jgi:hypothetical protein